MAEPALVTIGLTKRFRGTSALDGVDLEVPTGVVFGYLGPNGAGKTTTIRILAGLARPTAGTARVFGHDVVSDREAAQRELGYLPGDFVGYPELTGREHLTYLARVRGGVSWRRVRRLAERLGLDLDKRLGAMSHGNRQKVGLVQAFMHEPRLLVLDEPTAGLDPLVRREFLGLVREARQDGGTVFLSSHVLSEVEAVADRVAILGSGRVLVTGSVEELRRRARRSIDLVFVGPPPLAALRDAAGVHDLRSTGRTAHLTLEGSAAALMSAAAPYGIENVVSHEPDLEDVFLDLYAGRP
ncbi:ABC transporter ATP-binding protein [Nocardioides aurantiacus]|uniref:ABC transporter ATP-binding protein n=1 Tax=Nocardioides aurantiacus TaxID=86796 RepID=UPI000F48CF86|nr:ABC transporter ATP-binding protein [Nocardioides aurantiacus]